MFFPRETLIPSLAMPFPQQVRYDVLHKVGQISLLLTLIWPNSQKINPNIDFIVKWQFLSVFIFSTLALSFEAMLTPGPFGIDTPNCNNCIVQLVGFSMLISKFEFAISGYFSSLKSAKRLKIGIWKFSDTNSTFKYFNILSAEINDCASRAL